MALSEGPKVLDQLYARIEALKKIGADMQTTLTLAEEALIYDILALAYSAINLREYVDKRDEFIILSQTIAHIFSGQPLNSLPENVKNFWESKQIKITEDEIQEFFDTLILTFLANLKKTHNLTLSEKATKAQLAILTISENQADIITEKGTHQKVTGEKTRRRQPTVKESKIQEFLQELETLTKERDSNLSTWLNQYSLQTASRTWVVPVKSLSEALKKSTGKSEPLIYKRLQEVRDLLQINYHNPGTLHGEKKALHARAQFVTRWEAYRMLELLQHLGMWN